MLLNTGKKIVLNKGVYTDKELNAILGLELKSRVVSRDDVLRNNKLEKVMKMSISLDELDNSDNLKDGRPATFYSLIMLLMMMIKILRILNPTPHSTRNLRMVRLLP